MAVEVPSWLTKEYIQNALQHGKDYTITVQDIKTEMAVPKGTNFVCNVYRLSVEYSNSNNTKNVEKISLILKEPIYGPMYDTVLKLGIQNEVNFYNIVAPKINYVFGVSEDKNSGDDCDILPSSYFSSVENVIILEDMRPKGYVLTDRVNRFDYDHCVITLKALAKFHAGTKIITDNDPQITKLFTVILSTEEHKKNLGPIYMTNFKNLADEFKKRPELEKYSDWLYENYETGLEKAFKLMDPKENEFNLLVHGDFGLQNLLIKYSNNTPTKVLPIDYQGCRYSSPIIDLFYLLDFNTQEDVRNSKFDELVHLYVSELNYNLESYGSKSRLDESVFRRYIEEYAYLRVFFTVAFLAIAIGLPNEKEIFKMDDFTEDKIAGSETNPFLVYVKNEKFIKIITERFKEFEEKGLVTARV